MKSRLLIIGIILFVFGLGNFLFTYGYYAYFGVTDMVLLFPFAGTKSGNIPDPIMSLTRCDDCSLLNDIISRLGGSGVIAGFNEGYPFSLWELSWSLSLYAGITFLVVWRKRK